MTAPLFVVGDCYLCGQAGHWAQDCDLRQPATSEAEHQRRMRLYVDRWLDGHMTTPQKRAAIRHEIDTYPPNTKGRTR